MRLIYTFILFSAFWFTACTGTQNTSTGGDSEDTTEEISKEDEREEMILSEGYSKCEVVDMGSQDDCGFVLQDLNAKQLYRPLQWGGEFDLYKQNGNIVYIKYRASKATQTVCLQSMPIILEEMKLVE
jgi:hypothetical protein